MANTTNWVSEERYEGKKEAERVLKRIKHERKDWEYQVVPDPEVPNTWYHKRIL